MRAALCCVVALLVVGTFGGDSADLRLPEPPRQHAMWRPDAGIPTNILSAVETIYEQGFPDPRGCAYREIEVEVSGVWSGKGSLVKTHGWVLPAKSRETNRFAICWNGLIYPVAKISAPINLHAEVTNLFRWVTLTNKVNGTNQIIRLQFIPGAGWRNNAAGENATIFFTNALATRVLLLLRCGETEAALTTWQRSRQVFNGLGEAGRTSINDPYQQFASDWAWAMFDRTISTHQRGDEALALAAARQLAELQPKIEAECARRGFQRQAYYDYQRRNEKKPYLDFLEQLPQLLSDLERREKEGSHVSVVNHDLQNINNQSERIAALIHDLDLVQAHQWGQPGGIFWGEEPVVSALIREGDAAVEPLLNCLENDKRLTRAVSFWRDFSRNRTVIPVHDAAMIALQSILHAGFRGGVPEIRAYWNKYKGLKLEDRYYAILNDDEAQARWQEAAANIVQPENITSFPDGFSTETPASTNRPVRLRGEILRARANPTIAELMARRALEVPTNNLGAYDLSACCQMALYLTAWDPAVALPVARTVSKRACTVMRYSGQQLGTFVTRLALARARAGDPQAFDDYTAWVVTTTPAQLDFSLLECIEPLRSYPTNELLQAAAEKMFGDTNSAWSRLPWKELHGENPVQSDLVKVPAFRLLLVRELGETNVCGSFSWRAPNQLDYEITNYQGGSYGAIAFPSGSQPTNVTKVDLRWCDWIAFSLSNGKYIPFFNPFAPVEARNAAIEKAKTLLERR